MGPECVGVIDITMSAAENIRAVAKAKGESVRDVTAVILDRPRHEALIAEVRATGARIRLIPDGDVAGAISTAWPESGADILLGIGGTPEGVITAAAMKCMGGEQQGRLWPRNDEERDAAIAAGYDLAKVLTTDDLVAGDNCFFSATGITDGELLKGVHYDASAPPPSRWSCGPSPAPSARSTPATRSASSRTTPTSTSSSRGARRPSVARRGARLASTLATPSVVAPTLAPRQPADDLTSSCRDGGGPGGRVTPTPGVPAFAAELAAQLATLGPRYRAWVSQAAARPGSPPNMRQPRRHGVRRCRKLHRPPRGTAPRPGGRRRRAGLAGACAERVCRARCHRRRALAHDGAMAHDRATAHDSRRPSLRHSLSLQHWRNDRDAHIPVMTASRSSTGSWVVALGVRLGNVIHGPPLTLYSRHEVDGRLDAVVAAVLVHVLHGGLRRVRTAQVALQGGAVPEVPRDVVRTSCARRSCMPNTSMGGA